jgi:iron complex outermembrane receptor protein
VKTKACLLLIVAVATSAWTQDAPKQESPKEFADMELEELLKLEISSASKRMEKAFRTPAAVYVISSEEIRRSGHRSLPELLRLAPGVEVARIDGNKWAVAIRGFNSLRSEKILIMIDGRSVYTPMSTDPNWDTHDLDFDSIDRIEIIRGPGGTMWGANAVNGIINIITKKAKDTQGVKVNASSGLNDGTTVTARVGARTSDSTHFRVYAKGFDRLPSVEPGGRTAHDAWRQVRTGFRLDWDLSDQESLTFQGDLYSGVSESRIREGIPTAPFTVTIDDEEVITGGNLVVRWTKTCSPQSDLSVQFFYDHSLRSGALSDSTQDTVDLEFRHHFRLGESHEIVWGGGFRYTQEDLGSSFWFRVPSSFRDNILANVFVEDKITLIQDRLDLILGTKIEYNEVTEFEFSPTARVVWTPHERHSIWAAVSRAVRLPSVIETDLDVHAFGRAGGLPLEILVQGNPNLKSEKVIAYELGYRAQLTEWMSLDVAAYYNAFQHIQSASSGPFTFRPVPFPHFELPITLNNGSHGEGYGTEVLATFFPLQGWKLMVGYNFLYLNLTDADYEQASPRHKAYLRSSIDLPHNLFLDTSLSFVDALRLSVPSYWRFDVRLAWRPSDKVEFSIGGENLFSHRHLEFGRTTDVPYLTPTEVETVFYVGMSFRD